MFTIIGEGLTKEERDREWSLQVHNNYNGRCAICSSTWGAGSHHIIGRKDLSTRWVLENGVVLCTKHHSWVHERVLTEMYKIHCVLVGILMMEALHEKAGMLPPELSEKEKFIL